MIHCVFFDLDHTLYDRAATFRAMAQEFIREFTDCLPKKPPCPDEAAELLFRADREKYANWPAAYEQLADLLHWTPPGYNRYEVFLREALGSYAVPWKETHAVLQQCKAMNLKTAVVSNGIGSLQRRKIDTLGIRGYFDAIVISKEFGAEKPDPSIFLHAASLAGHSPREIAFVGDNPVNDIRASAAVGMTPVWMGNFLPWPENMESPKYIATKFADVPGILRGLIKNVQVQMPGPRQRG